MDYTIDNTRLAAVAAALDVFPHEALKGNWTFEELSYAQLEILDYEPQPVSTSSLDEVFEQQALI